MKIISLLVIAIVTFLFTLPRFDYNPPAFIKKLTMDPMDYIQYENFVSYIKSDYPPADSLQKPFTYRPFIPFLASLIPLRPITAINVLNVIFLIGAAFIFYFWTYSETKNNRAAVTAALFLGASYPVFMYGSIGIVDPGIIFFITLAIYLIAEKHYLWIPLLVIPGTLTKELILVIIPFYFLMMHQDKQISDRRKYLLTLAALFIYILIIIIIRLKAPGHTPDNDAWRWIPSSELINHNFKKITTWIGLILMLGIPGFLALWSFFKKKVTFSSPEFPYLIGFLAGATVFVFSLLSSYAGARLIWTSIPFSIPVAMTYLREKEVRFLFKG